ncbi:AAA domain-containing protein [Flavobacteriaceae bacterium Ap0902]|nr:AAA domain-containing protein [Flavobacteriaceae bacterium Ap0902]
MALTAHDLQELNDIVAEESRIIHQLSDELKKVIFGQEKMVESLLIALLSNGHILLEGVPGLAKTFAIKTLSEAIHGAFSRIQFTPDLLPADVVGTLIYNIKENDFTIKKGPIFANFILADEINRAPAKVQSALLESMQERQVTIGDETFRLEEPFMVMATQNPVEQEGTYPLPEAQIDRFMLKSIITYPAYEAEKEIMRHNINETFPRVNQIMQKEQILKARQVVKKIYMDEKIEQYILDLVAATRYPKDFMLTDLENYIRFGTSPRGSISLAKAAKVHAFLRNRSFVTPEDVREVIKEVLRHRIGITYEAEAEGINSDMIIDRIVNKIPVP